MSGPRFVQPEPVPGSSSVVRVHDTRWDVPRARRVVDAPPADWDKVRNRVRAISSLRHPALCQLVAVGDEDGRLQIVEEWLPGGDLATQVMRSGPLGAAQALQVAEAIVDGLGLLHSLDLGHGDIGADSIVFGADGAPRLVGLGVHDARPSSDISRFGHVLAALSGPSMPEAVASIVADSSDGSITTAAELLWRIRDAQHTEDGLFVPVPPAPWRVSPAWLLVPLGLGSLLVCAGAWKGWVDRAPVPVPPSVVEVIDAEPALPRAPEPPPRVAVEEPKPTMAVAASARPAAAAIVRPAPEPEPEPELTVITVPPPPPPAPPPAPTVSVVRVPEPAPPPAPVPVPEPEPEPEPGPPMGKWRVQTAPGRKHLVTTLLLDSENLVEDRLGRPGRPQLRVRCAEERITAMLSPGVASVEARSAENGLGSETAMVAATFSGQGTQELRARLVDADPSLYLPQPKDFVNSLRRSNELHLSYTPFAASSVLASFDVRGLEIALVEIQADCDL